MDSFRQDWGGVPGPAGFVAEGMLVAMTHTVAFLLAVQRRSLYAARDHWFVQIEVLLVVSFLACLFMVFARGGWAMGPAVLAMFCLFVISYADRAHLDIEYLLITSLSVEMAIRLPKKAYVTMVVSGGATLISIHYFASVMHVTTIAVLVDGLVLPVLYFGFISIVVRTLRNASMRVLRQRLANARLTSIATELTAANLDFQRYASEAGADSAAEERRRISREIHDTVGYTMTNITMMMQEAAALLTHGETRIRELVQATRIQAEHGWAESRLALRALRAVKSDNQPGLPAVVRLIKVFEQATGVSVRLELGNVPSKLPEKIEGAFQRVVQESLTNSFWHGHASAIDILFWMNEREYAVTVRDNGVGTENPKQGIGFSGILERTVPLGGTLRAGNVPGGFEVSVKIPALEKRANNNSESG